MVTSGILSKSERRKITRLAGKEKKEMSERQILRAAVKEKKMMPKLSNEDRRKKYLADKLEQEREDVKAKFTVCLGCRVKGHFLKDCPNAQTLASSKTRLICFNCGSADHPLRGCPEPRGATLPFATCFICKEIGHISRDCTKNDHGALLIHATTPVSLFGRFVSPRWLLSHLLSNVPFGPRLPPS